MGEHKDNKLERSQNGGYKKLFADSIYYGKSQGGDVSIPWFFSAAGYGFVWNSPSMGSVAIDDDTIVWVTNATKCKCAARGMWQGRFGISLCTAGQLTCGWRMGGFRGGAVTVCRVCVLATAVNVTTDPTGGLREPALSAQSAVC